LDTTGPNPPLAPAQTVTRENITSHCNMYKGQLNVKMILHSRYILLNVIYMSTIVTTMAATTCQDHPVWVSYFQTSYTSLS
jgi:hypothetical protein